jgi:hypothetical protein
MPNINSYADVIQDWQALLAAFKDNAERLPGIEAELAALEQALTAALAVKARQDSYRSEKQRATQELNEILESGRDLAIQLRGAVRCKLGPRNEKLVQFGMAPLRRRKGRKAAPATASTL